MRYELRIALRYLRARRKDAFISVTTLLSAVGVMIGVAALIVTLSVMGGFEASLKQRVILLQITLVPLKLMMAFALAVTVFGHSC